MRVQKELNNAKFAELKQSQTDFFFLNKTDWNCSFWTRKCLPVFPIPWKWRHEVAQTSEHYLVGFYLFIFLQIIINVDLFWFFNPSTGELDIETNNELNIERIKSKFYFSKVLLTGFHCNTVWIFSINLMMAVPLSSWVIP